MLEGFKINSVRIDNTNETFPNSDAWKVQITNPRGQTLTRKYYKGYGHKGAEPSIEEFMGSLISDADCVAYRSELDFANDLGYDYTTRQEIKYVHKIYKACEKIAERLETFLTPDEREAFTEQ